MLGADVCAAARERVPLDLVRMDAESLGGLGEVQPMRLAAFEAMTLGMPIVCLATAELATAIESGVSGYVDTDLDRLVEAMDALTASPGEARRLGMGRGGTPWNGSTSIDSHAIGKRRSPWSRGESNPVGRNSRPA